MKPVSPGTTLWLVHPVISRKTHSQIRIGFLAGIDGLDGHRQAMSAVNMLWNTNGYFWDGRAQKLRDQSIIPIQDVLEMNETMENVVEKLEQDTLYTHQFFRAFGSENITSYRISLSARAVHEFHSFLPQQI